MVKKNDFRSQNREEFAEQLRKQRKEAIIRQKRGVRWAENAKESLFRYNQQHDDVEREAMVNPQYT
jgi:hypothetical protein